MHIKPEAFTINDYLNRTFDCSCGQDHTIALGDIRIFSGANREIPEVIRGMGKANPFLVADVHTWEVAGKAVEDLLEKEGFSCGAYVFPDDDLVPDEMAIARLLLHYDRDCDLIVAVGGGTINDLCRYFSYQLGLDYIFVATAPSMDGYASTVAPLITNNMKVTYITQAPQAIIADVDILKEAPMEMITAGLGDTLGKYIALCDWKISRIVTGEYHCPVVAGMVETSLKKATSNLEAIKNREPEAIKNLTEALVLTGLGMSFVGNSRPASGCEHHLAHMWEMMFLLEGRKTVLHGTKVGVGTVVMLRAYELLRKRTVDFEKAEGVAKAFDQARWKQAVENAYKAAAPEVFALEEKVGKNTVENHRARLQATKENWEAILELIDTMLPASDDVAKILMDMDAPAYPAHLDIPSEMVMEAVLYAKELRNRYTLLQMLWDFGIAEEIGEEVLASLPQ